MEGHPQNQNQNKWLMGTVAIISSAIVLSDAFIVPFYEFVEHMSAKNASSRVDGGIPNVMGLQISQHDIDVVVRTTIGEAANEPDEGKAAVVHVILNRAMLNMPDYGGSNVADVALHRAKIKRPKGIVTVWQFEPWMRIKNRMYLWRIQKDANIYVRTNAIVMSCISGETPDPTGGATHFLNPTIVKARTGGSLPSWAQGTGKRIGSHVFYSHKDTSRAAI